MDRHKGAEDEAGLRRLALQLLGDAEEGVALMRLLIYRTDRRLRERIWHEDIEPLEREIDHCRALLEASRGWD